MKLLLENWKRYIVEASQQEQSYFGNTPQIADQIIDELDKWKATLQNKTHDYLQKNMHVFVDLVKQKIPSLTFMGVGKFRAAFTTDKDLVIKIDYTNNNLAKEQNEDDADMGRLGKHPRYSYLFPKSYLSHKDSKWVILEKVKPLTNNYAEFNKFFKFPTLEKATKNQQLITLYIRACLLYETGFDSALQDLKRNSINKIEDQIKIRISQPVRVLVEELRENKLFVELAIVCQKYNISPWEIKPDNVGITEDGRFVILDSSKLEQINKGLNAIEAETNLQKPIVNPNSTVPMKK